MGAKSTAAYKKHIKNGVNTAPAPHHLVPRDFDPPGKSTLRWDEYKDHKQREIMNLFDSKWKKGFNNYALHPDGWEMAPVYNKQGQARRKFWAQSGKGYPVSEVFWRFRGKTLWKRFGEVSSKIGDYEEAVKCQWTMMYKHIFEERMDKRARFWGVTDVPFEFGYADENATIVIVRDPLPEGTLTYSFKAMINRCGFNPRPIGPRTRHKRLMLDIKTKNDYHLHTDTKHMTRNARAYKQTISFTSQWFNPMKYEGKYTHYFGGMKGWAIKSHFVVGYNGQKEPLKGLKWMTQPRLSWG